MYTVTIKHFYQVEYSEDEKIMSVEVDLRESTLQIGIRCITNWNAPFDSEVLDMEKKKTIAENIGTYLKNTQHKNYVIIY